MNNKGFGKKHPTLEDKKKIIKAYESGQSVIDISKIFDFHPMTIYRWIREGNSGKSMKRNSNPGSGRFSKINEKSSNRLIKMLKQEATNLDLKLRYGPQQEFRFYVKRN